MGLLVFCLLAAFITATINTAFVAMKINDKGNSFLNWWRDTCQDRSLWNTDKTDWCDDGFYDHEGHYIAIFVFGYALFVCEALLCCFMTGRDVSVRKEQRRAMRAS